MPTRTPELPRTRDVNGADIRGRLLALSRSRALGRRVVHLGEDRDAVPAGEDAGQEKDVSGFGDRH
ncbi:hypothetical protein [Nitrospirillum sp. BR 11163]|uniref:hypothetical protein n=1 Tax=Nitrospirillum sp. BR 11163 TaxID=3104323 RepID=UPI002AFF487C|nr:hypothetical protein [Nitrospirillum sp. BR 11163]MEA1674336.1 hypothetical protein [Nitrospirillum sp. BR 11163]